MSKTREVVRAYSVHVNDNRVRELISWYVRELQKAIDIIWDNISWRQTFPQPARRVECKLEIPVIPEDKEFKSRLRGLLLAECPYAKHWVDAVIRTAYSIMNSWRKRYLKCRAKKVKPKVLRRFARCKITLMKINYERKTVRITLKPWEYLEVSWANAWFANKIKGWTVGEVVLKDDKILIPFKRTEAYAIENIIAWDSNELSLDGYSPNIGFIKVDLRYLQSVKIVYEKKKAVTQSHGRKGLFEKYARRERNRVTDFINKLSKQITTTFPKALHVVEDLDKENMVKREVEKKLRKRNARTPWKQIHRKLSEKAPLVKVSPINTSRRCPRCGYIVRTRVGATFECDKCGFKIDRQKLASINIYVRYTKMWGFPHSVEPMGELWVGVTLNGRRPMIWVPMKGALRPVKPRVKRLISKYVNRYGTRTPMR